MRTRLLNLAADAILWTAVACASLGVVWLAGAVLDTIGRAGR